MKNLLVTLLIVLFGSFCSAEEDDDYFLEYHKKARFHYNPFTLPMVSLLMTDYEIAHDPSKVEQQYFVFNIESPANHEGTATYGLSLSSGRVYESDFSIEPDLFYKRRLFFAALPSLSFFSKAGLGLSQLYLRYDNNDHSQPGIAPSYGVKAKLGVGAEFFFNEWLGLVGGAERSYRYQFPRAQYKGMARSIQSHQLYLGVATTF